LPIVNATGASGALVSCRCTRTQYSPRANEIVDDAASVQQNPSF
jgi:hypothetical protein